MTPDEVPQGLIDILNLRAGRSHSRTGSVVGTLAEILTEYDRMNDEWRPVVETIVEKRESVRSHGPWCDHRQCPSCWRSACRSRKCLYCGHDWSMPFQKLARVI